MTDGVGLLAMGQTWSHVFGYEIVDGNEVWRFHEINERVNLEIMKRFEKEGLRFAFPTQTVFVKKES